MPDEAESAEEPSPEEWRARLGLATFEHKVARIELYRKIDPETKLSWTVRVSPEPRKSNERLLIAFQGHLVRSNGLAWAQILVSGLANVEPSLIEELSYDGFLAGFGGGYVESMYDSARFAAGSMAVLMDLQLDLPYLSPTTSMERHQAMNIEQEG